MKKDKNLMFYYGSINRNGTVTPIVTVAAKFNPEDNTVTRGIAVLGDNDNASKKVGRSIALNRLAIAEQRGLDCFEMNFKSGKLPACMNDIDLPKWSHKGQYHKQMIDVEKRVFRTR